MKPCVVDTNVPIVANGRPNPDNQQNPSVTCREAAIRFLQSVLESGTVLLDFAGEIQAEYHRYLHTHGQPGVGDLFYQMVIQSAPKKVRRIDLPRRGDGEYRDLPQSLIDVGFDPSDRKFAALARKEVAPVINATDSDWLDSLEILRESGIRVIFVCGLDREDWFTP